LIELPELGRSSLKKLLITHRRASNKAVAILITPTPNATNSFGVIFR
jgi:hypothetical protein